MHGWHTYMLSDVALSTIARLAYVQVCRVRRDVSRPTTPYASRRTSIVSELGRSRGVPLVNSRLSNSAEERTRRERAPRDARGECGRRKDPPQVTVYDMYSSGAIEPPSQRARVQVRWWARNDAPRTVRGERATPRCAGARGMRRVEDRRDLVSEGGRAAAWLRPRRGHRVVVTSSSSSSSSQTLHAS